MNKNPDYNFMRGQGGICFYCGALTEWIEVNFEAYLCLECDDAAWAQYWEDYFIDPENWTPVDDDF